MNWSDDQDSGLFALPFCIIVVREWVKVRGEGADEKQRGALAGTDRDQHLYRLCGRGAMWRAGSQCDFDTLAFDQAGSAVPIQPACSGDTGWNTSFSSLAGKSAQMPVWWAL